MSKDEILETQYYSGHFTNRFKLSMLSLSGQIPASLLFPDKVGFLDLKRVFIGLIGCLRLDIYETNDRRVR